MRDFISDQYRTTRGGWSRMLAISCKSCGAFLFHYQKDGPGPIKRSYLDRILEKDALHIQEEWISCPQCMTRLGFTHPYAKENDRPTIRWAVEAIGYKIVPLKDVK